MSSRTSTGRVGHAEEDKLIKWHGAGVELLGFGLYAYCRVTMPHTVRRKMSFGRDVVGFAGFVFVVVGGWFVK